jgi:multidrug efflux pump subunit AcrA (membrane-fusion protein)
MGTLMMDAIVPNEGVLLRPGMYVTVRAAVGREENQLLVPSEAVLSQQGKNFLLVLEDENKITPVFVLTGVTQDGLVAVRGDLTAQMRIVVSGMQQAMMAAEGRARLRPEAQSEGHSR